ncbi:la-related protein 7 [Drosophila innubila]|uniref:la-related protein 7 n=1 Tax=Drosophila innubila TaxID=198719 RepID=UPI00148C9B75|nr:la-related protein 7 [Drosophila innubila]
MVAKTVVTEKSDGQELEKLNKAETGNDQPETRGVGAVDVSTTSPAKSDNGGGGRKRKRHLFNSIRAQMEFYFGDANLSKDRFLRRYVEQDPYVPLDIFLTFNKIKTLTQDVQQISRSLSNSQLLELDESGLKVRRKTALPVQRDVNDKTLYVEALPRTATHDWLKEVFSRYGAVAYVSLPHYPGTRKIKEFAFIEFEQSASVEKAVKAFAQVQGVLSMEHTDPADLASIRSFQQQQKVAGNADVQEASVESTVTSKQAIKREGDKEDAQETVAAKRVKLEQAQDQSETGSGIETTDAEISQQSETDDHNDDSKEASKQQKRRRKQKKRIVVDKHKPNIEPSAIDLKVLPKSSWCSMRNKYLNLQRRIISEAKSKLWRNSQTDRQQPALKSTTMQSQLQAQQQQLVESKGKGSCNSGPGSGHEETEPHSDAGDTAEVAVPPKRRKRNKNAGVHKMNMNFYGAGGSEADDTKMPVRAEDAAQERSPLFKYEPGLIVECALHEPCANVKDFKADMRQYTEIKYVDIKEGDQVAHLRMSTPNAADELTRQLTCAEMQLKVLRGQSETQYWRKIEQDREAKLTKKVRVQQKRGREKVAKLLAKHIKFDDADDEVAAPGGATNEPIHHPSIISIPADV